MRKCEGSGEAVETGVKMSGAVPVASTGRKRRVSCGGEVNHSKSFIQLRSRPRRRRRVDNDVKPENLTENAAASNSNDPYASCCSSNGSSEPDNYTSEFVDLEVEEEEESVGIETSTYQMENCRERRETTPSSEVRAESGELDSTALRPSMSSEAKSHERKMPSKAELEVFFSEAEKNLLQKFAQKYNFDIVKEEPLEGRYEWIRVKP